MLEPFDYGQPQPVLICTQGQRKLRKVFWLFGYKEQIQIKVLVR